MGPFFGKICCINEINCHLLQKCNIKLPECGMRITEIRENGIGNPEERPVIRVVRGMAEPGPGKTGRLA